MFLHVEPSSSFADIKKRIAANFNMDSSAIMLVGLLEEVDLEVGVCSSELDLEGREVGIGSVIAGAVVVTDDFW
jgi:hypothetical protein